MRLPLLPVSFLLLATLTIHAQDKLKLLDHPVLTVDSVCNPEGKGSVPLNLRNDGATKVTLDPAKLSAGNLATTTQKTLNIWPSLDKVQKSELDPNGIVQIEANVENVFEDGDWVSSIENDGNEIGKLRIVRNGPPFAITLDSATPSSPELTFEKGRPAQFWLKNADPREYRISWEYSVNGIASGKSQKPDNEGSGFRNWLCRFFCSSKGDASVPTEALVTVSAKGQKPIVFTPPDEWFNQVSVLKDQTADGYLTVSLPVTDKDGASAKSGCPLTATKTFPIKTHLVHQAGFASDFWGNFIIFLFLATGALFSLLMNFMLPNQMRKVRIKEQLDTLGAQIIGLSQDLASQLRVLVGLEHRLIRDRLKNISWTDSEFANETQNIADAMDRLRTRLQFLTTLGMTRTNFEAKCADVLPATVILELESIFDTVVSIGKKPDPTDDDVKTAQALIKSIQDRIDAGVLNNQKFTDDLKARATQIKADFDPSTGRVGKTATSKRVAVAYPWPFNLVLSTDPAGLGPATDKLQAEKQMELDLALFQLDIVRQYVDLVESMPDSDDLTKKRRARESDLITILNRHSSEAIHRAALLIRELNNGYFQDDIQTALTAKNFTVVPAPRDIHQFEPCEFRLNLSSSDLDGSAAKDEWFCNWEFTPPSRTVSVGGVEKKLSSEAPLQEEGWDIMHYFQQPDTYGLKITLTRSSDGTKLVLEHNDSFDGEIRVLPERRRRFTKVVKFLLSFRFRDAHREWKKGKVGATWVLEGARFAMALFIALLGLLAGAKEQLLKLDLFPALIAIFLIGFSADQVKNLMTQRPVGADSTAQK